MKQRKNEKLAKGLNGALIQQPRNANQLIDLKRLMNSGIIWNNYIYWYVITYTPWNFVQGGLIPEMIQVCDYDILIVLVELNTLI